jgi:hypothetical protein
LSKRTKKLEHIARATLDFFSATAVAADAGLKDRSRLSVDVQNPFTAQKAVAKLAEIQSERTHNLTFLREEPAIARIVFRGQDDKEHTYFICRATPVVQPAISYRAPMGRLASLSIDAEEEIRLPRGKEYFQLREKGSLKPRKTRDGWDSVESTLQGHDYRPVTIASFRQLLETKDEQGEETDIVSQLLAEEQESQLIRQGIRRTIIEKMALRDQPILDQFQDEIFRLPINSQLAVLGPPGSGKTTTLIKRLGLTLDLESLDQYGDEDNRQIIEGTVAGREGHADSWLMFTPTELLKQYVKEAFNQEGIAAPDSRIKTWQDYSFELGRGPLRILRTSTGGGPFVLKPGLSFVKSDTLTMQRDWYSDFEQWQAKGILGHTGAAIGASLTAGKLPNEDSGTKNS